MTMLKRKRIEIDADRDQAERFVSARVVAVTADGGTEPFPSPALALQRMIANRAADGFISDPALRRRALIRFLGTAVLLWGGAASGLAALMVFNA